MALKQLQGTVGVKSATHEEVGNLIIFIVELNPEHVEGDVIDRLHRRAASWSQDTECGFLAVVEY